MNISGISSVLPILPVSPASSDAELASPGGAAFHSAFTDAVGKVESFQQNAQASINRFLSGDGEELHQVALNTQQAEMSFDLFLQVRNKVVAAYEEVMRMQI
ncbi:MAG: flagellar hook-basal body complex protein FliE [Acidobacteriota bacterium]